MRSGTSLRARPVIAMSNCTRIGVVADLVVDVEARQVAAVVVSGFAGHGGERLLPFESIRGLGPDAVTVDSDVSLIAIDHDPRLRSLYASPVRLLGLRVLTESGKSLGTVADILIDELVGAVDSYVVSAGPIRALLVGRWRIPTALPLAVGSEMMIVPEALSQLGRIRPGGGLSIDSRASRQQIGGAMGEVEPSVLATGRRDVALDLLGTPVPAVEESDRRRESRREGARDLWEQVARRLGQLTSRR